MSFESIFATNEETNPNLDKLFKKRKHANPDSQQIINAINDLNKPKNEQNTSTVVENTIKPETKLSRRQKAVLLKNSKTSEEIANRTIFVGNLPAKTKKEHLLKLFKPFGKIETIRFRNIVPEDQTKTKKYAFITKQTFGQMKSINAFIRFSDEEGAKKSLEMNGKEFEDRHLRVDMSNGNKTHDNKRSVFLGGLSFGIEDETIFKHFMSCGEIDYVRVVRDNSTGIGKGIGYVTFKTSDSINLALKLNGSEIDNRKIRVERCVKKQKVKKLKELEMNKNKNKKSLSLKKRTTGGKDKIESVKSNKKIEKKKVERKKMNKIKTNRRPTNKFKF